MGVTIIFFIILEVLCGIKNIHSADESALNISVQPRGSYRLLVNNVTWLASGYTVFRGNETVYTTEDGSLKLMSYTTANGSDTFSRWLSSTFIYLAGTYLVNTTIKVYTDPNVPAAIFTQTYLDDATGTSAANSELLISKFPTFRMAPLIDNLGYLSFAGDMGGYSGITSGRLQPLATWRWGTSGGPFVIFDNSSNAIVVSPMSQFMAASNDIDVVPIQQMNWGIMGLVDAVPRGYTVDFIVYYSNKGINHAMRGWGNYLTTLYKKSSDRRDNDLTIQYLGYWTNNGAYYYYNTQKNQSYETTVLDMVEYINNVSIPFGYLEFDSWWYPKGAHQGTKTWEPMSDVFPNGFGDLYNKTKLPFGCHNRFWDTETTYAQYNGGQYTFIPDNASGLAVPDDSKFWQDLFNRTQTWGRFVLYEQDWLSKETYGNIALLTDLYLGRRWLLQMGQSVESFGTINIQYCMSYGRHLLQSLEIPVVTQARVSSDYQPGNRQWNIGISSLFADSLNVAPFKDTFWTTEKQPGSPYDETEPHTRLQALMATLSTGPVGPGDGIGFIDRDLLMKCCDASGVILKPMKPATAIDDQIKRAAFKSPYPGPDGEVYSTYSNISGVFFGIVLLADLKNHYALTPASAWPSIQFPTSLAFPDYDRFSLLPFSNTTPINFGTECSAHDFCLYYTSQLLQLDTGESYAIMGELEKWVPMSHQRVNTIQQTGTEIFIQLMVQANELVTITYYAVNKRQVNYVVCDNRKSSTPALSTLITIPAETCVMN